MARPTHTLMVASAILLVTGCHVSKAPIDKCVIDSDCNPGRFCNRGVCGNRSFDAGPDMAMDHPLANTLPGVGLQPDGAMDHPADTLPGADLVPDAAMDRPADTLPGVKQPPDTALDRSANPLIETHLFSDAAPERADTPSFPADVSSDAAMDRASDLSGYEVTPSDTAWNSPTSLSPNGYTSSDAAFDHFAQSWPDGGTSPDAVMDRPADRSFDTMPVDAEMDRPAAPPPDTPMVSPDQGPDLPDGPTGNDLAQPGQDAWPDTTPDQAVLAPCDLRKPFGPPTTLSSPLNFVPYGSTSYVSFSEDELTAFYTAITDYRLDSTSFYSAWMATRPARTAPFSDPVAVIPFTVPDRHLASLSTTRDGLETYAALVDNSWTGARIYRTRRESVNAPFGVAEQLTEISSSTPGSSDSEPVIARDGGRIYFVSDRSGDHAIYVANRTAMGFAPPVAVAGLLEAQNRYPVLSADELTIYYVSSPFAEGPYRVYVGTRASLSEPFSGSREVSELSDIDPEAMIRPTWLSDDGCRLYFTRVLNGTNWIAYMTDKPE